MASRNKEMEYYRAGMERAYRLYKEDGPEALEKEIRFRNVTGINSRLTAKEIDIGIDDIKWFTIETVLAVAYGVLYSEWGFGKKRLTKFRDVYMEAVDALAKGIVTWADICYNIEDLTGIRPSLVKFLDEDTGMLKERK